MSEGSEVWGSELRQLGLSGQQREGDREFQGRKSFTSESSITTPTFTSVLAWLLAAAMSDCRLTRLARYRSISAVSFTVDSGLSLLKTWSEMVMLCG